MATHHRWENVQVNWAPHFGTDRCPGGQVRVLALTLQNKVTVVTVGRQWGKTQVAMMACYEQYRRHTKSRVWHGAYCSPTYKLAEKQYREAKEMFHGMYSKCSDSNLSITFKPTKQKFVRGSPIVEYGKLHFWSLERHDNLRGHKLDWCVVDEFCDVVEEAYTATLTPMLLSTEGRFLLIGTPRRAGVGYVWARREFMRGLDPYWQEKGYACMTGPSEGNPYLSEDQCEHLRSLIPDPLTRREEYDAEWVPDTGGVFQRIEECHSVPAKPVGGNAWEAEEIDEDSDFVIGYDIGIHDNPAVISVFDLAGKRQVYLERMFATPFATQFERLKAIKRRFGGGTVYADINGMGEVPGQEMAMTWHDSFIGVKWNSRTKEEDVTRGIMLFQEKGWALLNIPWQIEQFYAFQRVKLPSGGWRYEAADGSLDDAVCACLFPTRRLVLPYHASSVEKKKLQPRTESGGWSLDWFLEKGKERLRRATRTGYYR